jgi:hypothetical protein
MVYGGLAWRLAQPFDSREKESAYPNSPSSEAQQRSRTHSSPPCHQCWCTQIGDIAPKPLNDSGLCSQDLRGYTKPSGIGKHQKCLRTSGTISRSLQSRSPVRRPKMPPMRLGGRARNHYRDPCISNFDNRPFKIRLRSERYIQQNHLSESSVCIGVDVSLADDRRFT